MNLNAKKFKQKSIPVNNNFLYEIKQLEEDEDLENEELDMIVND